MRNYEEKGGEITEGKKELGESLEVQQENKIKQKLHQLIGKKVETKFEEILENEFEFENGAYVENG